MSKITLTDEHGTYSIDSSHNPVTIIEIIDYLLKPVLLAAGFSEQTVNEAFGHYEEKP